MQGRVPHFREIRALQCMADFERNALQMQGRVTYFREIRALTCMAVITCYQGPVTYPLEISSLALIPFKLTHSNILVETNSLKQFTSHKFHQKQITQTNLKKCIQINSSNAIHSNQRMQSNPFTYIPSNIFTQINSFNSIPAKQCLLFFLRIHSSNQFAANTSTQIKSSK